MPAKRTDLKALRRMIAQAETILKTTDLPEGRAERARELLSASVKLADHLLTESPAAALGAKGGQSTAKRGSDFYRKIAGLRKTRKGGRPRKEG